MSDIKEKIKPKMDLREPSLFNVIYQDDDVTTMEFVIDSLIQVFNHTPDDADDLMRRVHEEGSAVVAVLPYELAEQKGVEVTLAARNKGFPLNIRIEQA
jgi:ATP-dependent Clp protease adaptor protein ClpS